jgi:hypothetical protein
MTAWKLLWIFDECSDSVFLWIFQIWQLSIRISEIQEWSTEIEIVKIFTVYWIATIWSDLWRQSRISIAWFLFNYWNYSNDVDKINFNFTFFYSKTSLNQNNINWNQKSLLNTDQTSNDNEYQSRSDSLKNTSLKNSFLHSMQKDFFIQKQTS